MKDIKVSTESITTDVLILGGGIAGCVAAIRAKEAGADVILVDKGCPGRSGLSFMMSGILSYFDPDEDDYDQWYREAVESGEWLNDQVMLQGVIPETTELIREMNGWGVGFQKEGGRFIRKPGAGMHYTRNVLMTNSGYQMMSVIRGEVLRRGARVVERVMVTDLLSSDGASPTNGRVSGAVGFNIRTGKPQVFKAKTVVIATGDTRSLSTNTNTPVLSGDGKAMAFRVGGEMRNVDLYHYSPHPLGHNTAPGLNMLAGEGAIFVNSRGERFMEKWDAIRLERAPRTVVCQAMAVEEMEGRGPVYWDATHLDDSAHRRIEQCIPIIVKSLALAGLSYRKDKIRYTFGRSDLDAGGIRVNHQQATTVPGLFAAGAATDMGQVGVTCTIQPGIHSVIHGHRAGKAAARLAADLDEPRIDQKQVGILLDEMTAPLSRGAGLDHRQVRAHCMNISAKGLLGPVKNESRLKQAITEAQEIRQNEIPKLFAKDYHELARTIGLSNELFLIELFPRCSLVRQESRGAHFREDYPKRDDANWLKWVIAKREGDGIKVWTEPIPFDQYPLRPESIKKP